MGTDTFFDDFLQGHLPEAYRYFGAHKTKFKGQEGYLFRVYAPRAKKVSVIGAFNGWNPKSSVMDKKDYRGLFEIFIPGVLDNEGYKYQILCCDNVVRDKQDPFAFSDEIGGDHCSFTVDLDKTIHIDDDSYIATRNRNYDNPRSIFEFHRGTFRRKPDGSLFNYSERADILIPYRKERGYTHVEALPLTSYPNDASWGYQTLGYFAIDKRYGSLADFAAFVEKRHKAGIGIIRDFVPVHFALDSFGLEKFDGSCVYEYNNEHEFSQWGTKNFDLGKDPVRSFLISSLHFRAQVYHIDGFRFDAVSNIIYWDGNSQKGENSGAIEFIKRANGYRHTLFPTVRRIAEDSSAYGHVTKGRPGADALGFDYKWDLGWRNDTLKYYGKDPIYRKYCHNQLTFSRAYFYSENFILPLSHDEVVHRKGSILNKRWGDYDTKFANVRNLYAYRFAHPGKKLNFRSNDLASFDEWKETEVIPWDVLDYPKHKGIHELFKDLNRIYRTHPARYFQEYNPVHFNWIMADNSDQSVYVFERETEEECRVFLFNRTPNFYRDYDIGVPYEGRYEEILNTDNAIYGGWNQINGAPLRTHGEGKHNQPYKITVKIPSFGAIYLRHKKTLPDTKKPYVSKDGRDEIKSSVTK